MTDRIKGFIVTLKNDVRDDDSEPIAQAIRLLTGVVDVSPLVADYDHHCAREQIRHELGKRLQQVLYPDRG